MNTIIADTLFILHLHILKSGTAKHTAGRPDAPHPDFFRRRAAVGCACVGLTVDSG